MPKGRTNKPLETGANLGGGTESEARGGNGNGHANQIPDSEAETKLYTAEEVAARAYDLYEREGRADGHDADHWYRAESELRNERMRKQESSAASAQTAPRSARQF